MIKIYDHKTKKLREVILDPGEKQYLCKQNLLQALRFKRAKELILEYDEKNKCAEEKD